MPYKFDVSPFFSDPDGNDLNFRMSGLPARTGLEIDSSTGLIYGVVTTADALASPQSLGVTATDRFGLSVASDFKLVVHTEAPSSATCPFGYAWTGPGLYCIEYVIVLTTRAKKTHTKNIQNMLE